ncbi:MAG: tyrosine-type recombinase/integrase [Verrucomicrobiales bacterium]
MVYSLAEVRAILAHTDERNLAFVVLGLFAGIRPFELYRLPCADVNLDQRRAMIRRDVSKTKKPRKVELEPNVVAMLLPLTALPIAPEANARKITEAPRKAAGLTGKGNDVSRHTYASMHLTQFNDLERLQANMGHETPKMTLTNSYDWISAEDAVEFWGVTHRI